MSEEHERIAPLVIYGYPIDGPRDLVTAAALGAMGHDFVCPFMSEYAVCCRCGKEMNGENRGWHSFQVLKSVTDRLAGYAMLIHCSDCPPEKLIPELAATGTYPRETDEWKFTQGKLE